MKVTPNKDLRYLLERVEAAGYVVEKSSKHVKVTNPNTGGIAFIPSTPRGGMRTRLNMLRDLKRIGYITERNHK